MWAQQKKMGSSKEHEENFNREAEKIFAALNLKGNKLERHRYNDLDAIMRHAETGATVYVGNRNAASSRETLDAHGIKRVVNCTADLKNFFEDDEAMSYFRFEISSWMQRVSNIRSHEDCLEFSRPMLEFVDAGLEQGESVLIHCLAGAHRAGTTGIIVLMSKLNEPFSEALMTAKLLRPIINPIGLLKTYAERYSLALAQSSLHPSVISKSRPGSSSEGSADREEHEKSVSELS